MLTQIHRCPDCKLCEEKRSLADTPQQAGKSLHYKEKVELRCSHPNPPSGPLRDTIPDDCPIQKEAYMITARKLLA